MTKINEGTRNRISEGEDDIVINHELKVLQAWALITSLVVGSIAYEVKFGFPIINRPFERSCPNSNLGALADAFEASSVARDYIPYKRN